MIIIIINVQHFWLMFQTFVNKKCMNVTYMKLKEDFESDEIFDFLYCLQMLLFCFLYFLYINVKRKINVRFFMYLKKHLTTRHRREEYLS